MRFSRPEDIGQVVEQDSTRKAILMLCSLLFFLHLDFTVRMLEKNSNFMQKITRELVKLALATL